MQKSQSQVSSSASQGTQEHNGSVRRSLRSATVAGDKSPKTVKKGAKAQEKALSPYQKAQLKVLGSPQRKRGRLQPVSDEDEDEDQEEDEVEVDEEDKEDEEDDDGDGGEGKLCLFLFAFLFVVIGSAILAANAQNFSNIYRKLQKYVQMRKERMARKRTTRTKTKTRMRTRKAVPKLSLQTNPLQR